MLKKFTFLLAVCCAALLTFSFVQTRRLNSVQETVEEALASNSLSPLRAAFGGEDAPGIPSTRDSVSSSESSPFPIADTIENDAKKEGEARADGEEDIVETLLQQAIDAMLEAPAGAPATSWEQDGEPPKKKRKRRDDGENGGRRQGEILAGQNLSRQLYQQAREMIEVGQFDDAAALLAASIENDPANSSAYRALAQLQRKLGLRDAEMQVYQDWAAAVPGDATPHYLLADAYVQMGMGDLAYEEFRQYQSMAEADRSFYLMSASMLRRLDMRGEEGMVLDSWAADVPESPDAHRALGDYYQRGRDFDAAAGAYETVVSLTPENPSAHVNLARAYGEMGMHGDAQAEYQAAVSLRPEDASIRWQLAESYRRSGDLVTAISAYQDVIAVAEGTRRANQAARRIVNLEQRMQQ